MGLFNKKPKRDIAGVAAIQRFWDGPSGCDAAARDYERFNDGSLNQIRKRYKIMEYKDLIKPERQEGQVIIQGNNILIYDEPNDISPLFTISAKDIESIKNLSLEELDDEVLNFEVALSAAGKGICGFEMFLNDTKHTKITMIISGYKREIFENILEICYE